MEHPALEIYNQAQQGKRVFSSLPKRTADAAKMLFWRNGIKIESKKNNGLYDIKVL